jgi:hypothetical protein
MPTYDFKCRECGKMQENVLLRITHDEADKPCCCGETMQHHITTPPMVHWVDPVIEPFRAIATKDRPVITTTKQNREYMARNGLVDANEISRPPTMEEDARTKKEIKESIEAITPSKELSGKLAEQGLDSVI